MKIQSRMKMLTVAILFAMAFALTLSLVFAATVDYPDEEMQNLTVEPPSSEDVTHASNGKEETPTPIGMLEFASNGNGTCAVCGIGTYTSPSIAIPTNAPNGDRVTSIAPQAFYGEVTLTAVQIPATVGLIGNLAFAECPNLRYVSVDSDNAAYCSVDGVLYTADMSVLILYPPARAGESVTLYAGTTVIREMAFYRCTYLKVIRYTGSPSQWERISIGTKNYALLAVAKEFGTDT